MKPTLTLALALLLAPATLAGGEGWTEDFEAAKAQAREEGKDLLIDFTGSDWCGWCIRLDDEVFSKEPFKAEAPKKYVLVSLDFPRAKEQDEAIKKQNAELQRRFGIEGFPTIYLADAEGRPYARTGYQPGGPEKYLAHLDELQANKARRDEILARADAAQGVDRARALDEALAYLGEQGISSTPYESIVDEIIALDAEDEGGLKSKYESAAMLSKVEGLLNEGQFDEAIEAAEALVANEAAGPDLRQKAYYLMAVSHHNKEDREATLTALRAGLEAQPKGEMADQIRQIIGQLEK